MTPHDELMALAGRIEDLATEWGDVDEAQKRDAIAADLRALLDSDAFRAMVRDAERLDFYTENQHRIAKSGGKWCAIIGQSNYAFFDTAREAIDAAASGAITPPTSEGGRDE